MAFLVATHHNGDFLLALAAVHQGRPQADRCQDPSRNARHSIPQPQRHASGQCQPRPEIEAQHRPPRRKIRDYVQCRQRPSASPWFGLVMRHTYRRCGTNWICCLGRPGRSGQCSQCIAVWSCPAGSGSRVWVRSYAPQSLVLALHTLRKLTTRKPSTDPITALRIVSPIPSPRWIVTDTGPPPGFSPAYCTPPPR